MFFYSEFGILLFFIIFSLIFSIVLFGVSLVFTIFDTYSEKLTPYECGFDPFEDARSQFDIRFYLVAILFLIFDLEASFLIPWALCLSTFSNFGYWVMVDFFIELVVGFYYVWVIGALDWE